MKGMINIKRDLMSMGATFWTHGSCDDHRRVAWLDPLPVSAELWTQLRSRTVSNCKQEVAMTPSACELVISRAMVYSLCTSNVNPALDLPQQR